jgi:hypothetical protein
MSTTTESRWSFTAGAAGLSGRALTSARTVPPAGLAVCAAGLWLASLGNIDVSRVSDLGLVSVLPVSMLVAFGLLTWGYCLALRQQPLSVPLLLVHLLVLVLIAYGTVALVEEQPRYHANWRLVGISDYVIRHGAVDGTLDAFSNWPGFFILSAFGSLAAGLDSPIRFAAWAPLAFNLMYLGPLVMVLESASCDRRLVWLGVWFFFLVNWVGQDYLAPQGLNYCLFLVTMGILLRWFKTPQPASPVWVDWLPRVRPTAPLATRLHRWLAPVDGPGLTTSTPAQRVGLMGIVLALFAVMVSSHQLTPFFTLGAVSALVFLGRLTTRGLPVVMAVMIGAWLSYMAVPFLEGHLNWLTRDIGRVSSIVGENVGERMQGSAQHVFVVYLRMAMTVAIWGLALCGGIRRLLRGQRDITLATLALVPFGLLALQAYGGEMLLRVYLFSLPAMLFFVAALFFPTPTAGRSWATTTAIGLSSLLLFGGFLFARYGNERMDLVTSDEVAAVSELYRVAEPGSVLMAGSWNLPWRAQGYEQYEYVILDYTEPRTREIFRNADVDALAGRMETTDGKRAYLIITRSEEAEVDLFSGLPSGKLNVLEEALIASPRFTLVFSNPDATIFTLADAAGDGQPR